jgi:hypothetical protein
MRFRVGFHGWLALFVLLYMLVVVLVVFGLELTFNIVKLLVLGVVALVHGGVELCREVSRRRETKAAEAAAPQAWPGLTGKEA